MIVNKFQPLETKRYYVLLALSRTPLHPYGIVQQTALDSSQSLHITLTSLRRILAELTRHGLIDLTGMHQQGSREVYLYHITEQGRRRLRNECTILERTIELTKRHI